MIETTPEVIDEICAQAVITLNKAMNDALDDSWHTLILCREEGEQAVTFQIKCCEHCPCMDGSFEMKPKIDDVERAVEEISVVIVDHYNKYRQAMVWQEVLSSLLDRPE